MTAVHQRPRGRAALAALAALAAVAGVAVPAAARADLLAPTPLILKDGRIASVSVHVLPFAAGAAAIDAAGASSLLALTRDVATDCFLTAQVIGHVGEGEIASTDTLAAHRLARSRADAVQASLIDKGLPAKSIASVWDWQFMVLEPRATLWVFRLTEGEDCEGNPLDGAPARVATSEPPVAPAPARAAEPPIATAAARASEPRATTTRPAVASDRSPPVATTTSTSTTPAGRASGSTARAPAVTSTPLPAVAPSGPVAPPAPAQRVARAAPTRAPEVNDAGAAGAAQALSITFASNSSYFPAGTAARLEALMRSLEQGGRYRVELIASVSDASSVVGATSPEEAARYNQWLANRRLDRVQNWLEVNVKDKDLIIQPDFRSKDDSREVEVRIVPVKTTG